MLTFCEITEPKESINNLSLDNDTKRTLSTLLYQAHQNKQALNLYLYGPKGTNKRGCAESLANHLQKTLLNARVENINENHLASIIPILFREAWFSDAVLLLDGIEVILQHENSLAYQLLTKELKSNQGVALILGENLLPNSAAIMAHTILVPFSMPNPNHRRICWEKSSKSHNLVIDANTLDTLSTRFRLTEQQIEIAVGMAENQIKWLNAKGPQKVCTASQKIQVSVEALYTAARSQSSQELVALTQKIKPTYTWDDIILPEDAIAQLREVCDRVVYAHQVLVDWGFDRKLTLGKGVNALFSGSSGAGKTMAAEVIANELQLDLYKIDLSRVVSKYIGETEKNLDRIFSAAKNANAILFFDEADALFGKRSEVKDSHDRHANIETSYLLQKMEQFEGTVLLATNERQNMDTAFTRRLACTINFPFPDAESRLKIWCKIWPKNVPLAEEVDLTFLAKQFIFSGGNIKNVALAASFLAAKDNTLICMEHLLIAIRREYQKMGKLLSKDELQVLDIPGNNKGSA